MNHTETLIKSLATGDIDAAEKSFNRLTEEKCSTYFNINESVKSQFEEFIGEINKIKEYDMAAGNLLHTQLEQSSNSQNTISDLSEIIKSEDDAVDLLDDTTTEYEVLKSDIRNV